MLSFLKPGNTANIKHAKTKEDLIIDDVFSKDHANKPPQYAGDILEVKIISFDGEKQEIEITYGKKKRRKIITNFLPQNLASDFYNNTGPSGANIGTTNIHSLSQDQRNSLIFHGKLLNILAKVNFLSAYQKDNDIDYQKFWDGPQRIAIDDRFYALSQNQKQQAFEQENNKRKNYLTTAEKAILVAMVNAQRIDEEKVDRQIISQNFAEIEDKEAFKDFVYEILALIDNKNDLMQHFFPQASIDYSLLECLHNIIHEPDFDSRQNKIKLVKIIIEQKNRDGLSR